MPKATLIGLGVIGAFLLGLATYVVAAGEPIAAAPTATVSLDEGLSRTSETPDTTVGRIEVVVPNSGDVYDPVDSGDDVPAGIRQLLPRDAIAPIYAPVFVKAEDADWDPTTLVIGIALEGEEHAYPVSFLNRREMVLDQLGSSPVLVTW